MKLTTSAVALFVVCVVSAIPVFADTMTYTVNVGNAVLSGFAGPYATATVDLTDATHATITFDSLINGGNIYLLGGENAVGVNVNATSWSITGFTGSNTFAGFTPGPWSDGGSQNVSTFGVFNQTVESFDGFTHSATEIMFTLTNLSGTWANAASVLAGNSDGHFVEIHAFVCAMPCDVANGAVDTGFGTDTPIPEPASMVLFGSGLVGLAGLLRRKRRN